MGEEKEKELREEPSTSGKNELSPTGSETEEAMKTKLRSADPEEKNELAAASGPDTDARPSDTSKEQIKHKDMQASEAIAKQSTDNTAPQLSLIHI